MDNDTELIIRRGESYADRLRAYKVAVDRVVVASVRAGSARTARGASRLLLISLMIAFMIASWQEE
jgi:hypothetical protein